MDSLLLQVFTASTKVFVFNLVPILQQQQSQNKNSSLIIQRTLKNILMKKLDTSLFAVHLKPRKIKMLDLVTFTQELVFDGKQYDCYFDDFFVIFKS